MKHGAKQYKQTSIMTASRGKVLLMLYEGAIRYVKKASDHIEKKETAAKGEAIGKAHDIINELINTLNFDVGGKIAEDLERLYNFMIEQLLQANMTNSQECLKTVQKLLETLLDGWKQAVADFESGKSK